MAVKHLDTEVKPQFKTAIEAPKIRPGEFQRDAVGAGISALQDTLQGVVNRANEKENKRKAEEAVIVSDAFKTAENIGAETTWEGIANYVLETTGIDPYNQGGAAQRQGKQVAGRNLGTQWGTALDDNQTKQGGFRKPADVKASFQASLQRMEEEGYDASVVQGFIETGAKFRDDAVEAATNFQIADTDEEHKSSFVQEGLGILQNYGESNEAGKAAVSEGDLILHRDDVRDRFVGEPGNISNVFRNELIAYLAPRENWDEADGLITAYLDKNLLTGSDDIAWAAQMRAAIHIKQEQALARGDPGRVQYVKDLMSRAAASATKNKKDGKPAAPDQDIMDEINSGGDTTNAYASLLESSLKIAKNQPGAERAWADTRAAALIAKRDLILWGERDEVTGELIGPLGIYDMTSDAALTKRETEPGGHQENLALLTIRDDIESGQTENENKLILQAKRLATERKLLDGRPLESGGVEIDDIEAGIALERSIVVALDGRKGLSRQEEFDLIETVVEALRPAADVKAERERVTVPGYHPQDGIEAALQVEVFSEGVAKPREEIAPLRKSNRIIHEDLEVLEQKRLDNITRAFLPKARDIQTPEFKEATEALNKLQAKAKLNDTTLKTAEDALTKIETRLENAENEVLKYASEGLKAAGKDVDTRVIEQTHTAPFRSP